MSDFCQIVIVEQQRIYRWPAAVGFRSFSCTAAVFSHRVQIFQNRLVAGLLCQGMQCAEMVAEIVNKPPSDFNLFPQLKGVVGLHGQLFFGIVVLLLEQAVLGIAFCQESPQHHGQHIDQHCANPFQKPSAEDGIIGRIDAIPETGTAEKEGDIEQLMILFVFTRSQECGENQVRGKQQLISGEDVGNCGNTPVRYGRCTEKISRKTDADTHGNAAADTGNSSRNAADLVVQIEQQRQRSVTAQRFQPVGGEYGQQKERMQQGICCPSDHQQAEQRQEGSVFVTRPEPEISAHQNGNLKHENRAKPQSQPDSPRVVQRLRRAECRWKSHAAVKIRLIADGNQNGNPAVFIREEGDQPASSGILVVVRVGISDRQGRIAVDVQPIRREHLRHVQGVADVGVGNLYAKQVGAAAKSCLIALPGEIHTVSGLEIDIGHVAVGAAILKVCRR